MIIMLILSSVVMEEKYCPTLSVTAKAGTIAAESITGSKASMIERIFFFILSILFKKY